MMAVLLKSQALADCGLQAKKLDSLRICLWALLAGLAMQTST